MNLEAAMELDTLDIAELEYDVAGAGSAEQGDTEVSQASFIVAMNWMMS